MAGVARKSKKVQKAEKKSDTIVSDYLTLLRKGRDSHLFLAKVQSVEGAGHFVVKDLKKDVHRVRVSKTLFAKGAKHRNATMKTAIHVSSNVLVDGDLIRAVVGERDAAEIKSLVVATEKEANNNIFSREGGFFSKTRKNRKSYF